MKAIHRVEGAQLVPMILTAGLFSGAVLALGASAPAPEVTAPQMIDAFEDTFGVHPGQRRNHIKGTCAVGQLSPDRAPADAGTR